MARSAENGLRKPYDKKTDVYSWSMLMWYFLALEPPYGMYTPNMIVDRVHRKGYRPLVDDKWPDRVSDLLTECWATRITMRPSFTEVAGVLKKQIEELEPMIGQALQRRPEQSARLESLEV